METNEKTFLSQTLSMMEQKQLFDDLYRDVNGYLISASGRVSQLEDQKEWTYGEVSFDGIQRVLDVVQPTSYSCFYDVGSGTGKAMIIASLTHKFKSFVGVEICDNLADESKKITDKFSDIIQENYPNHINPSFTVKKEDAATISFDKADVVLLNSTYFNEPLMEKIRMQSEKMKIGSHLITLTIPFVSDQFELLHSDQYLMEWGKSTVYIYKKT